VGIGIKVSYINGAKWILALRASAAARVQINTYGPKVFFRGGATAADPPQTMHNQT